MDMKQLYNIPTDGYCQPFNWEQLAKNASYPARYISSPFISTGEMRLKLLDKVEPIRNDFILLNSFIAARNQILHVPRINASPTPDEGFISPGSDFYENGNSSSESGTVDLETVTVEQNPNASVLTSEDDSSPSVSQEVCNSQKNWEYLGNKYPAPFESHFASEVPETISHLVNICNTCSTVRSLCFRRITVPQLVADIRNLLYGNASQSFVFNEMTNSFETKCGLYMDTLSPELLQNYCTLFITCANKFIALKHLSNMAKKTNLSERTIYQTFCDCLLHILYTYICDLEGFDWNSCELISLSVFATFWRNKLCFLSNFCFDIVDRSTNNLKLPKNELLLDYIYSYMQKVLTDDLRFFLYYIFEKCCNSYFKLLKQWIFEGNCNDRHKEWFIDFDTQYEQFHDRRWLCRYVVNPDLIPNFLKQFHEDIFNCGKSISLLKACWPEETLCKLISRGCPDVICCFNKDQLDTYVTEWKEFGEYSDTICAPVVDIADIIKIRSLDKHFYTMVKETREAWFNEYEKRNQQYLKSESDRIRKSQMAQRKMMDDFLHSTLEYKASVLKKESKHYVGIDEGISDRNFVESYLKDFYALSDREAEINRKLSEWKIARYSLHAKRNMFWQNNSNNLLSTEINEKSNKSTIMGKPDEEMGIMLEDQVLQSSEPEINVRNSKFENVDAKLNLNNVGCKPKIVDVGKHRDKVEFGSSIIDTESANINEEMHFIKSDVSSSEFSPYSRDVRYSGMSSVEQRRKATNKSNTINIGNKLITSNFQNAKEIGGLENILNNTSIIVDATNKKFKHLSEFEISSSAESDLVSSKSELGPKSEKLISGEEFSVSTNKSGLLSPEVGVSSNEIYVPLSAAKMEAKRNKAKVMSSEFGVSSSHHIYPSKIAVQTEAMKNKLKIMSSEFGILSPNVASSTEFHEPSVRENYSFKTHIETEAMRNKQKMLSSELGIDFISYGSNALKIDTGSEQHKNKRKMMASSLNSTPRGSELLMNSQNLSEAMKNKLKVLSSEYHVKLSGITENKAIEPSIDNQQKRSHDASIIYADTSIISDGSHILSEDYEKPDSRTIQNSSPFQDCVMTDNFDEELLKSCTECDDVSTVIKIHFQDKKFHNGKSFLSKFEQLSADTKDKFNALFYPISYSSDVDVITIPEYLQTCISIPLKIQLRLANEAILRLFLEKMNYFEQVESLKNYFFLQKPDFSLSISNHLFLEIEKKCVNPSAVDFDYNNGLGIVTSNLDEKLSLYVDGNSLRNNQILEHLSLHYSCHWPLNILITEPMLSDYNRIFKILLQIYWTSWILQKDFLDTRRLRRGYGQQYREVQLYRHTMIQVVRSIQHYVEYDVIESCWYKMANDFTRIPVTLEILYDSHNQYLKDILQRLILSSSQSDSYNKLLTDLFRLVLEYHCLLNAGTWHMNNDVKLLYHTNFKKLQEIFAKFMNTLTLLKLRMKQLIREHRCWFLKSLYSTFDHYSRSSR